jgi:DNA repair protein RadC
VTARVARAGRVLGAVLLDHLVVASSRYTSMAEGGHLPTWTESLPTWTA